MLCRKGRGFGGHGRVVVGIGHAGMTVASVVQVHRNRLTAGGGQNALGSLVECLAAVARPRVLEPHLVDAKFKGESRFNRRSTDTIHPIKNPHHVDFESAFFFFIDINPMATSHVVSATIVSIANMVIKKIQLLE